MTAKLRIQLLGEFALVFEGCSINALRTSREQSLLSYLLLHRSAPQSRQYLSFNMWPNSSEAQARTNLRNLLHTLRQSLPDADDFLLVAATTIQWRPDAPYTLDVAEFEQACATGALREALDLYGGDLLPGCYQDWIQPERERLHHLFAGACEQLVSQLERRRDYPAALAFAGRLLRHDPLREETHRTVIRLHALNDDRAAALAAYRSCVTMLRRELQVEPDPATQLLYKQLVRAAPADSPAAPAPVPPATSVPLVDRGAEWARILEAWRAAARGTRSLLLLSGEPGIGKTRLAEELLAWAGRQGIQTAAARCYAAEGALAYAPVVPWLRSSPVRGLDPTWRSEIARLLPELLDECPDLPHPGPIVEPWQRQRFYEALARAVLAGGQPLLLWLDDVQWCDRDTLEWLRYLLRLEDGDAGRVPLLVLGTLRAEELSRDHPLAVLLPILRCSGQLTEIEVGPLTREATIALGERVAGHRLGSEAAEQLYRETEGNPLFVLEIMRAGTAGPIGPHGDDPNRAHLPPGVQAAIAARLSLLSPPARDLIDLAATIGREFSFAVLRHASRATEADLVGRLDELWRRRIIREQGEDGYDFTHDKLREVAYGGLSSARRRWLHRLVAEALEAVPTQDPGLTGARAAAHYDLAGMAQAAILGYCRAGEAMRRVHANQDTIDYYRRALALISSPPPDPGREGLSVDLHEALGDVLGLIGQQSGSREEYQAAVALASTRDPFRRARLHRKLGNAWLSQRRFAEAQDAYDQAEAALGPEPGQEDAVGECRISDQASAVAAWWQVWTQIQTDRIRSLYWQNQGDVIDKLIAETRPAVERYGTAAERAGFFHALASLDFLRYRYVLPAVTVAHAGAYLAAEEELGDPIACASARFTLGFTWLWHGRLDDASRELEAALQQAERVGHLTVQVRCLTYLAVVHRKRGMEEETRLLASRSLALATSANLFEYVAIAHANQAWVAWRDGNLARVEESGRAALASWRSGNPFIPFHWLALWPLIAAARSRGDLHAAIDYARPMFDSSQQPLPEVLATVTRLAVDSWDECQAADAASYLKHALELAQDLTYL